MFVLLFEFMFKLKFNLILCIITSPSFLLLVTKLHLQIPDQRNLLQNTFPLLHIKAVLHFWSEQESWLILIIIKRYIDELKAEFAETNKKSRQDSSRN